MLNRVCIGGRLTRDPEIIETASGVKLCRFSVACERNYKGKGGERETDFFDVNAWRGTAEFISRFYRKGSAIIVDGKLEQQRYTDRDGNSRSKIVVVADTCFFGETKRSGGNGEDCPPATHPDDEPEFHDIATDEEDEDLPF